MARPAVAGRYLPGPAGPLAMVVWSPPDPVAPRFGVLYLPPFGDEMNKSRRMAALQARALAGLGGVVALLDPRGTGDSGGDHADATWAGWQDDVACAWDWVAQSAGPVPRFLWGLRLGALLALESVALRKLDAAALLLWQPVASGKAYFNQQFRVVSVARDQPARAGEAAVRTPRAMLGSGEAVEIAGYEIAPALFAGAERVDLATISVPGCPVVWRDVSSATPPAPAPAAESITRRWRDAGAALDFATVAGPSFWATLEIAEAPALVQSTTRAVEALVVDAAAGLPQ